jgi:hypothetical protein
MEEGRQKMEETKKKFKPGSPPAWVDESSGVLLDEATGEMECSVCKKRWFAERRTTGSKGMRIKHPWKRGFDRCPSGCKKNGVGLISLNEVLEREAVLEERWAQFRLKILVEEMELIEKKARHGRGELFFR